MADVDGEMLEQLRNAWLEHKVLVLRDQPITVDQHIAFGRRFGVLEVHPFAKAHDEHPEIVTIRSTAERRYAASVWHSDVTWRLEPSMGSILRGVEIPSAGGDTCFADAGAAYQRLSDEWKHRVDPLFAVHDHSGFVAKKSAAEKAAKAQAFPAARHPVIRTHPETGERSIYTNRAFVSHVEGVPPDESEEILDHLERQIMDPSVQCRVRWEVDTFVMWDNRAVQHYATDDFHPETRHVERVTIVGDKPF